MVNDNGEMKFGEAIKAARTAKKMSQQALGARFGVSKVAVGKWEKGDTFPDHEKLPDLMQILDLDPALVLGIPSVVSRTKSEDHKPVTSRIDTTPTVLIPLWDIMALGGAESGEQLQLTRTESWTAAPQDLRLSKFTFAVQAWDDENAPWVRRGSTLFINPTKKPRDGDWTLFAGSGTSDAGILKNPSVGLLLARKGNSWAVQRGMARLTLALAEWPIIMLIEWIKP